MFTGSRLFAIEDKSGLSSPNRPHSQSMSSNSLSGSNNNPADAMASSPIGTSTETGGLSHAQSVLADAFRSNLEIQEKNIQEATANSQTMDKGTLLFRSGDITHLLSLSLPVSRRRFPHH